MGQKVLHLVEENQSAPVPREQALGQAKLLQPLATRRFAAVLVRFPYAEERDTEAFGHRLAEFGLPGSGRPVEQDVDARRPAVERALQQPLDMVPVSGHMVEIGPVEFAPGGGVQQQAVDIEPRFGRSESEPIEPVDGLQVAVIVDGNEPGADERRVIAEAAGDRACRKSQQQGQGASLDIQIVPPGGLDEDLLDHRFEHGMCLVAHQKFQDGDVRPGEPCRVRQAQEAPAHPVAPRRRGRTLVVQRLPKAAKLLF